MDSCRRLFLLSEKVRGWHFPFQKCGRQAEIQCNLFSFLLRSETKRKKKTHLVIPFWHHEQLNNGALARSTNESCCYIILKTTTTWQWNIPRWQPEQGISGGHITVEGTTESVEALKHVVFPDEDWQEHKWRSCEGQSFTQIVFWNSGHHSPGIVQHRLLEGWGCSNVRWDGRQSLLWAIVFAKLRCYTQWHQVVSVQGINVRTYGQSKV